MQRPKSWPSSLFVGIAYSAAWGLFGAIACGCAGPPHPADWITVQEITPRFLAEFPAADPSIAADPHGRIALTFVTPIASGADLWLSTSRDSGRNFSAPVRVNLRRGRVVSDPEGGPTVVFGPGGALAIAWSAWSEDSSRVDLMVRASGDGGVTLEPPQAVNDDTDSPRPRHVPVTHAFPALTFLADGSLFATWLDTRESVLRAGKTSVSSVYSASSQDGGQSWSANRKVADGACPCCRPVVRSDPSTAVAVAYRRGVDDLRDPALAISLEGGRSFSHDQVISPDGWRLEGCPAQGPALTWNRPGGGHYAWYTGAGRAGVYVVPWRADRGAGGVKRLLADSLLDGRRPRLAPLGTTTLIAVEARPLADTASTVLAVRALDPDGTLTPWSFFGADVETGWIAGADQRNAVACWVDREGEGARVRVVRLTRRMIR